MKALLISVAFTAAMAIGATAHAADAVTIEMKGGQFNPSTITIPEFESYELNREEKIKPGDTISVFVGPLDAGSYPLFDDYNPDAKGTLIAK
jgi:Cupredoxin-like domain